MDEDKLNFLLIQIEQQLAIVNNLNQQSTQTNIFQSKNFRYIFSFFNQHFIFITHLLVITTYKSNFDNLKSQIKVYIDDANKCINLHEQRDSVTMI